MRCLTTRSRPYICLPCQLKIGKSSIIEPSRLVLAHRRKFSSGLQLLGDNSLAANERTLINSLPTAFRGVPLDSEKSTRHHNEINDGNTSQHIRIRRRKSSVRPTRNDRAASIAKHSKHGNTESKLRRYSTASSTTIELSAAQQDELKVVHSLRQRLSAGLGQVAKITHDRDSHDGIPIDTILKTLPQDDTQPLEQKLIQKLGNEYAGRTYKEVNDDLTTAAAHRNLPQRKVTSDRTRKVLVRLGVLKDGDENADRFTSMIRTDRETSDVKENDLSHGDTSKARQRPSLVGLLAPQSPATKKPTSRGSNKHEQKQPSFPTRSNKTQSVEAHSLRLESVKQEDTENLPTLSFDLSRVLFNPGIYQLRDPRSRVYNFDPYLEHIMPVSEFNFDALTPYQTSSEDNELLRLARQHGKRYTGSSSSMTSALAQFHFLISQWRELNTQNFTRGFDEHLRTFTAINRAPAAIFLRYRDGVYAVDADKEYDEPNMLMALGKSMEKLLTLEKDEFEKWRKSNAVAESQRLQSVPDVFHYSQQGRFILRSQLDTWDPRLPGKGYFDLKTRAVAGIRMNIREVETGMGYQIKERYGTWESYEREYYDMMRSTFLKYSLQVRMGDMDGIFVAYHNIARIFGFQYVPVSDMDVALHGQADPCLGDQEFKFSINFMEEIFNMGTEAFPEQSLRIHFETREASVTEPKPYMQIFIEPMSEQDIRAIQDTQKKQHEAFERKMMRGEEPEPEASAESLAQEDTSQELGEAAEASHTEEAIGAIKQDAAPSDMASALSVQQTSPGSNAANVEYLDQVLSTPVSQQINTKTDRELMALKLTIQNKVNNQPTVRPEEISPAAKWTIDYKLEPMSKETARRMYTFSKNRRMSALKAVLSRGSNDYFIRTMRQMSERGAEWRREQDELDAQREQVVLYGDRRDK